MSKYNEGSCWLCKESGPLFYKSMCGHCITRRLKLSIDQNDSLHDEVNQLTGYIAYLTEPLKYYK